MRLWGAVVLLALGLMPAALGAAEPADAPRVDVRGEWFYVDGEPYLVKGIGYSPYRPGQLPWAGTVGLEVMAGDFAKIREAGFNTLRTWSPLSPEQLALARQYGLMVLQGIWVDPKGEYNSDGFQHVMLQRIRQEVGRAKDHPAVLAFLVGNELWPEQVYRTGMEETSALLRGAAAAVKAVDPGRLVSYSNWPQLIGLDHSMWDFIGFNVYPYEPATIAHSFGVRAYVEHLRKTLAGGKPLVITESGLSVAPAAEGKLGYGGLSPEAQAKQLVQLVDDIYQAKAQGVCVFEWNDEWWKQADYAGDEQTHEGRDPEEWFGLAMFEALDQSEPTTRPAYDALKAYNQAILISPVSGEAYQGTIPVSLYATDEIERVRVRVEPDGWKPAAKVSAHWWKAQLPVPRRRKGGAAAEARVVMEAKDHRGKTVTKAERLVLLGSSPSWPTLTIQTDRERYELNGKMDPLHFTIRLADGNGRPILGHPVDYAIIEGHARAELVQTTRTDEQGLISGTYLMGEPGRIVLAAGAAPDLKRPRRRVGAETSVVVERGRMTQDPPHQPSGWERRATADIRQVLQHAAPAFQLADPGVERVVDYARYGTFQRPGTSEYRYEINDRDGLAAAVGEGIYPNERGLLRDPGYRHALEHDALEGGSVWDFLFHEHSQLAFFKWAGADDQGEGVRQLFVAQILERAGLLSHAVKAYHAVLVHFAHEVGWTEFQTPWYVGPVARDRLEALLRLHPELGLRLEDARILVEGGFDSTTENDRVIVNPGRLAFVEPVLAQLPTVDVAALAIKRELGKGRVRLRQYANGHWQLLVDGKPWIIRGISYWPSAVGESPDEGTRQDWMLADRNANGKIDGIFEAFVDANRNQQQDLDEPMMGDAQLFKAIGVNTLRLYHHASNKPLLRQLYEQYGVMVLMGDLVGMYTVGSGAKWEEGTDYLDPVQRKRMTDSVRSMVREFKEEPYILMWVLGNENNYGGVHGIIGGVGNAAQHPKEFYAFLNDLAEWIHKEDPAHPVAIANGEWLFLDTIAGTAPAIDVFGANVYRGTHGFGRSFFDGIREYLDKPVLITEFGCPAYQANKALEEGELGQALYHFGNWIDLEDNMAGRGVGNVLGGVVFSWIDEWWKAGQPPRFSPSVQETVANWGGPFPGGKMYEEWLGIIGQGDGRASPYLRQPRKAYGVYRRLWKGE